MVRDTVTQQVAEERDDEERRAREGEDRLTDIVETGNESWRFKNRA